MYQTLLWLHSWIRWAALLLVVWALIRAIGGLATKSQWKRADSTWLKAAAHTLAAQFVVGLMLYAASPYIRQLMGDMAATMRDRTSRFFVVEHAAIMFLAVAALHVGVLLTRGETDDAGKHRRAAICVVLALALMAYGIPWDRPMVR